MQRWTWSWMFGMIAMEVGYYAPSSRRVFHKLSMMWLPKLCSPVKMHVGVGVSLWARFSRRLFIQWSRFPIKTKFLDQQIYYLFSMFLNRVSKRCRTAWGHPYSRFGSNLWRSTFSHRCPRSWIYSCAISSMYVSLSFILLTKDRRIISCPIWRVWNRWKVNFITRKWHENYNANVEKEETKSDDFQTWLLCSCSWKK